MTTKPTSSQFNSHSFISHSEEETCVLGQAIGQSLTAGIVVGLCGQLGAGKTRLVKAIAESMGVRKKTVNSPTFVLIQEYDGTIPLYHFDTYRLNDTDEFLELGADELMYGDGVCLIEWADRVEEVLPADHLRINIEITGENSREFHLNSNGKKSQTVLNKIQLNLKS